jgi:alkylhydroperoxidase family enzyme
VSRSRVVTEEDADRVWDGYSEGELASREVTALRLTDAMVVDPRSLTAETKASILREFGSQGAVELAVSAGMFMSMSKVLIAFGLEPAHMETTVLDAPVAPGRSS